ncbi:MAG: uroporphyrinogen-III C-methyltransferase [Treponema sp.]|jgi:uroporphyrinogen III methyltransferase/synthase|nr:uroporphyrinogen-III C-methyltransferase [Treponema sp.]
MGRTIRVGSRESALAVIQSELIIKELKPRVTDCDFELVTMKTSGDLILDRSLDSMGGKGLFVKELDRALLENRIDMAVHSLKDLPVYMEEGIRIGAYSFREDPRDALVLPRGTTGEDWISSLTRGGAKPVGCSGQRRKLQLGRLFPGIGLENIRGNVLTRLEKLDRGDYGALVLAAAGLKRLGLSDRISRFFEGTEMLSAAGQGIMAVTVREGWDPALLEALDHAESRSDGEAERSFVRALDGNCAAPIAAYARGEDGNRIVLTGMYCPGDYGLTAWGSIAGPAAEAEKLGTELARRLRLESQAIASRRKGKAYLIGAGPGDPGLFTLKGDRVLQEAEVVLYDNLVGRGVLSRIPPEAETIYVGKKSGRHTLSQEAIGALLVEKAAEGKRVVRLKGGDPFLFGRGGEELEGLKAAGIPFEVVPGISSAFAVPAYFGIPVTHRERCSQVHLITGHGGDSIDRDIDYSALVKAGGTMIFLMGLASLETICKNLIEAGLDPQTPGAVLAQGTTAKQRKVLAQAAKLPAAAREAGLESPAIIVIGAVCAFSEQFSWAEARPLAGLRIGITRPKNKTGRLAAMLAAEGAEVVELSSIRTIPVTDGGAETALKDILDHPRQNDWLVFTSPTGVEVFFEKLRLHKRDIRSLGHAKFAAIGSATAGALESRGIVPNLVPEQYSGDALGRALRKAVQPGERVILPRSRIGTAETTRHLEETGINFLDIPLYDTIPAEESAGEIYRNMLCENLDWIVFTSASTVEGFFAVFGAERIGSAKALCIGAQTAAAAKKHGMETTVAENATLESLLDRLRAEAGKGSRSPAF